MTKAELEKYRQRLLDLGKSRKGNVRDLQAEAFQSAGGEASGNLSNVPVHMADLASDNFEQEVSIRLLETEEQILEEIAEALERVDNGTFGRCQECSREISKERLSAIPYTRLCIDCANQAQRRAVPAEGPGKL
ncbi:MAG TPA: TraR/DksA family transcriptional regulator [Gemmataceae bacterium]|nr:TraR/DksA family transcriptional regulator [Gemmataceae bacterium]